MRRNGLVVFIMIAEEGFAGGAHAQALGELFRAAVGDPGDLGGEALHMVLFLLKEGFGDEHGHIYVFMPGGFEHPVENMLNVFPDGIAVGAEDHAAAHAGIVDQIGFFDDIGVPLGEVLVHRGDGLDELFLSHRIPPNC